MRVTKAIKEYIATEVRAKIEKKYEAETKERQEQLAKQYQFIRGVEEAMRKAFDEYIKEHFHEVADFMVDRRNPGYDAMSYNRGYSNVLSIKTEAEGNLVERIERKKREEVEENIQRITVELELGGNKETLAKLLEGVGQA